MTLSATQPPTQNRSTGSPLRPLVVILAVAGVAALLVVLRGVTTQKPVRLGHAQGTPSSIQRREGAWYWLERTIGKPTRLVRADDAGIKTIATADALPRYAVENGKLAWSARQGSQWTIWIAAADGSGPHALWSGPEEPMGLMLAGGRLYWLHRVPALIPDGAPFAPLSAGLEALAIPQEGGPATTVGRLWEPEDGEVLGFHDNALYVSTYRRARPGSMRIYRIAQGAPAVRIAGESGHPSALLTHEGVLYWLAPSAEAANAFCLRRIDGRKNGGQVATLSDWLPQGGALYETTHGVLCGGTQDGLAALWPEGRSDVFPQTLRCPAEYIPLAAGENEALLASKDVSVNTPNLYQMRLP